MPLLDKHVFCIIDMIWLYRSAISMGGDFLAQIISTLPSWRLQEERRESAPYGNNIAHALLG
jgi:hypothetical protein